MSDLFKAAFVTFLFCFLFTATSSGGQWAELNLFDWSFEKTPYWATSEIQIIADDDAQGSLIDGDFGPGRMFDGDPYTYWAEGSAGNGEGETVLFAVEPGADGFIIVNGAIGRNDINRVSKMTVALFTGFSFPGYVSEIARGYASVSAGNKTAVTLGDRHSAQTVKLTIDWNGIFSDMNRRMEEAARKFGAPVSEIDVRFIVRLDIEEVYGSGDTTGITEIAPLYDQAYVDESRSRFARMPGGDYDSLGCYIRHRLRSFAESYESGDLAALIALFAPEDIVKHTGIFPEEAENADQPELWAYVVSALSMPYKDEEYSARRIVFTGAELREGMYVFDLELKDDDGNTRKGRLRMQADTGLFVQDDGLVEEAVG